MSIRVRLKKAIERGLLVPYALRAKHPAPTYPADHKPFMIFQGAAVNGSLCSRCKFLSEDGKHCGSDAYIAWNNGSNELLGPADKSCSDWFVEKL